MSRYEVVIAVERTEYALYTVEADNAVDAVELAAEKARRGEIGSPVGVPLVMPPRVSSHLEVG